MILVITMAGAAGLVGLSSALGVGGNLLSGAIGSTGKIKGKSATDRRIREQYQTMVKDLKLAGLNPMLAYTKGGSSSATGTALAQKQPVDLTKGLTAGLMGAQLENIKAQTAKTMSEKTMIDKQVPRAEMENRFWGEVKAIVERLIGTKGSGNVSGAIDRMLDEAPTTGRRVQELGGKIWDTHGPSKRRPTVSRAKERYQKKTPQRRAWEAKQKSNRRKTTKGKGAMRRPTHR